MGIKDLTKKYELNEIVSGDSIFCATGITSGDLVSGIKIQDNEFISKYFNRILFNYYIRSTIGWTFLYSKIRGR